MVPAENTVYHDARRPASVILPVVPKDRVGGCGVRGEFVCHQSFAGPLFGAGLRPRRNPDRRSPFGTDGHGQETYGHKEGGVGDPRPTTRSQRGRGRRPAPNDTLETFDSLHFFFRFVARGRDRGVDFLPRAGDSSAVTLSGPDGLHHLPEPIQLNGFRDGLDGHVDASRGQIDLLSHPQCPVRLDRAFDDDGRGIHDIHLTFSSRRDIEVCTLESNIQAGGRVAVRRCRRQTDRVSELHEVKHRGGADGSTTDRFVRR
jgi:hypothetical protein